MSVLFAIVAPVFALILIGYCAGRAKILGEQAAQGVTDFAFTLGIPALLCRTIATAKFDDLAPLQVWISFFGAAALTWIAASIVTTRLLGRPAADAPPIAMSSVFGNTAMLGLPLAMTTFGQAAAAPVALVLSIHAPLLWTTGMLHSETVGAKSGTSRRMIVAAVLRDLVRNPIVIGIILGAGWRLTGQQMPVALDRTLELLAQAGVPASLVALGLTLNKFEIKGTIPTLASIVVLKLVLFPILAWVIAAAIFKLPPVAAGSVVILAAMPTGANAYLFAVREDRAVNSTSGAVALGTVLAAATAAFVVWWVKV